MRALLERLVAWWVGEPPTVWECRWCGVRFIGANACTKCGNSLYLFDVTDEAFDRDPVSELRA